MKASGCLNFSVIFQLLVLGVVQTKENTKGATVKTTPFEINDKVNGIQGGGESTPRNLNEFNPNKALRDASPDPQARKSLVPKLEDKNYCEYANGQDDAECSELDGDCLDCDYDAVRHNCQYGKNVTVHCNVAGIGPVVCKGKREFNKEIICQYCYQTPIWQQRCNGVFLCNSVGSPRQVYKANCTVAPHVLCFGKRRFTRMMPCNWKNGYRWSTTLILSITLGGFGADRFYLGRWQEGIGKLFSFGGLGLWTMVDIILIGVRYLGPYDGSLYVD